MNKKYLDKVVDQLVSETRIESNGFYTPFSSPPSSPYLSSSLLLLPIFFSDHCRDIYGLNNEEINYVWEQYKNIIEDKIKNKNP